MKDLIKNWKGIAICFLIALPSWFLGKEFEIIGGAVIAIILGMVYNFLPFMVLPIYNSLSKIDQNVINAARDLGANNVQVFTKITLPLTVPGIISGITMVFIPALTTFVISKLLGGSKVLVMLWRKNLPKQVTGI